MQLPSTDHLEHYIFRVPMASDALSNFYEESRLDPPAAYVPSSSSSTLDALRGAFLSDICLSLVVFHELQVMVSHACSTSRTSVQLTSQPFLKPTLLRQHMFVFERFGLRRLCLFCKPHRSIGRSFWPCLLGLEHCTPVVVDIGRSWSLWFRVRATWLLKLEDYGG